MNMDELESAGMLKNDARLIILIPALNEADNIQAVIQGLKGRIQTEIVVIDDCSTDQTVCLAREAGATVLPLAVRLGAWGAIRTGIRYAQKHGFGLVVTMDADGQHLPESLDAIIAPVLANRADVVIGSCTDRGSAARKLTWRFFRRLTGLDIKDLTSGFRAYDQAAISAILSADTALLDYQDIGVLLALRKAGFRIVEEPVPMCARKNGHSRVFSTWWQVLRYLVFTLIICISEVTLPIRNVQRLDS
jgi:hypothetical protein